MSERFSGVTARRLDRAVTCRGGSARVCKKKGSVPYRVNTQRLPTAGSSPNKRGSCAANIRASEPSGSSCSRSNSELGAPESSASATTTTRPGAAMAELEARFDRGDRRARIRSRAGHGLLKGQRAARREVGHVGVLVEVVSTTEVDDDVVRLRQPADRSRAHQVRVRCGVGLPADQIEAAEQRDRDQRREHRNGHDMVHALPGEVLDREADEQQQRRPLIGRRTWTCPDSTC